MSLGNIFLVPGIGSGFSMVSAAQSVTPLTELWTQRSAANQVRIMLPINATQAYYYDIGVDGDECMMLRNMYRRLYTRPGGIVVPGTNESLIKFATRVEVAVRCRLNGTADTYRWFPQHEGINTAFLTGSRLCVRDGVELTGTDAGYVQCNHVFCDSTYNCVHPDVVEPLARLRLRHDVTAQRVLATVDYEFLQDTEVDVFYTIMNNIDLVPKLASVYRSDTGQIVPVTLGGDVAAPGQDFVTAVAMGQSGDTSVLIADWSTNLQSVRMNGAFNSTGLRQFFITSVNKFYNAAMRTVVIPAGQTFTWNGSFRLAEWSSVLT